MILGSAQQLCDPRFKWPQVTQHYLRDVPVFVGGMYYPPFDPTMNQREVEKHYFKYATEQLHECVRFCEKHTGKKMDWDRLEEIVDLSDRTWDLFIETYELRKAHPTPMDTGDAMNTMVPIAFMLGTQEAYDFYKDLHDELDEKIARKEGVATEEKYRLLLGGRSPFRGLPWPISSTSMPRARYSPWRSPTASASPSHASTCRRHPIRWSTSRRDLSATTPTGTTRPAKGRTPCRRSNASLNTSKTMAVTASSSIPPFPAAPGMRESSFRRRSLRKVHGDIPILIMEGDIVDISAYNEADTHNRIDAFIEALGKGVKSHRHSN